MRLIDADKIIITLLSRTYIGDGEYYLGRENERDSIIDVINELETVCTEKHSFWIEYSGERLSGINDDGTDKYKFVRYYRCDNCRNGSVIKSNYCPRCGFKMDGELNAKKET